jgi:hypothetical protein
MGVQWVIQDIPRRSLVLTLLMLHVYYHSHDYTAYEFKGCVVLNEETGFYS